jgi:hypothetical protein
MKYLCSSLQQALALYRKAVEYETESNLGEGVLTEQRSGGWYQLR